MTIYIDLNIEYNKLKPERQEMYNFREIEGQQKFKLYTSLLVQFNRLTHLCRVVLQIIVYFYFVVSSH